MLKILIGHRGTGKTSLLRRLELYFPQDQFFDLDQYIENKSRKTISEIFHDQGEDQFRNLERKYFHEIESHQHQNVWLSVGAGFDLSLINDHHFVIWVQRESDHEGRIFLNRPRLAHGISALEESKQKYQERDLSYESRADYIYHMPEGAVLGGLAFQLVEKKLFDDSKIKSHGIYTPEAEVFKRELRLKYFFEFIERSGSYIEIRDDILSLEDIKKVLTSINHQRVIYSFRDEDRVLGSLLLLKTQKIEMVDWDQKLGLIPQDILDLKARGHVQDLILSDHTSTYDQFVEIKHNNKWYDLIKYAPLINSLAELEKLHPLKSQVNLLPMSTDGRWAWYRLLNHDQPLKYVKWWKGTALDQPSMIEFLMTENLSTRQFAAVVGSPINRSYSPLFHYEFFTQKKMMYLRIKLKSNELQQSENFLVSLGLKFVSVTSPLKEEAAQLCDASEPLNTLFHENQWLGTLTDHLGFAELIKNVSIANGVVIWGGGGVLKSLQHVIPQAILYSSRDGTARNPAQAQADFKGVVVWAAPDDPRGQYPPARWKPLAVIDINYFESSPGLEYASSQGIPYISGLEMFKTQALEQQKFWKQKDVSK